MSTTFADSVCEGVTSVSNTGGTGLGPITLSGTGAAVGDGTTGRTFAAGVGTSAVDVKIRIVEGTAWEICDSTTSSSSTILSRGTLRASSTGSRVAFTSAAKVMLVNDAATANALESQMARGVVMVRNDGSTTQSFASGASTKVSTALTTVVANQLTWWDTTNKKFLPTRAGKYLISVAAGLEGLGDGKELIGDIHLNGSEYIRLYRSSTGAAGLSLHAAGSAIVDMNGSTDYVEFYLYNGDSSSRSTAAAAQCVYFGAAWLSA